MTHTLIRALPLLFVLASPLVRPALFSQTAAPAPAEAKEDTVKLSPFEVTSDNDVGYRAASTLAGTRTNEELKNVPAAITVFNEQMMQDIGATELMDVLAYSVGGQNAPPNDENTGSGTQFRGFFTANNRRNFFFWNAPQDTFSTERIDVVRGPNGILFGDTDIGGLANANSKQARFQNKTSASLGVGSWDRWRATADINRKLTDKWAARLNLLSADGDMWEHWAFDRRKGFQIATTYRLDKNTSFRAEDEYGNIVRNVSTARPGDRFSSWDGVTPYVFNAATGPAGTARLSNATAVSGANSSPNFWVFENGKNVLTNQKGFAQTTGTSLPAAYGARTVFDTNLIPHDAHFKGPNQRQDIDYNTWAAYLEHRFSSNFLAEIAYNLQVTQEHRLGTPLGLNADTGNLLYRDPNRTLDGTALNPHYGDYYLDIRWIRADVRNRVHDWRATSVYEAKPFSWMTQRLFANAGWRNEKIAQRIWQETRTNDPVTTNFNNSGNAIHRRIYVKGGDTRENTQFTGLLNDPVTGVTSDFLLTSANSRTDNNLIYAQLSANGNYWNGMFRTLLGIRRDKSFNYIKNAVRDPNTGLLSLGPTVPTSGIEQNSPTAGVLFTPIKPVTIFYNYSKAFRPINSGRLDFFNVQLPPRIADGKEYGVRFDLLNRRLYINALYYDDVLQNVQLDGTTLKNAIQAIWNNQDIAAIDPNYSKGQLPTGGNNGVRTLTGKGYEFEVTANPTDAWTLVANFGTNVNVTTSIADDVKNYVAANRAGWQAKAALSPAIAAGVNQQLSIIDTQLASTFAIGAKASRFSKYRGSFLSRYNFKSGPLSGFYFGGGLQYKSRALLTEINVGGKIIPLEYGPSTTVINLLSGYSRKLNQKVRWNVSLNINNALDRDLIEQTGNDQGKFGAPRSFMLNNTFTF